MLEMEQSEIFELEFPHCVRVRPGMYLPNITHMIYEIVDNSLDEYTAGYCSTIATFIEDDVVAVVDNGRGIPIAPSKSNPSVSQVELAATTLHAGGKFNVIQDENGEFITQENGVKTTGLHGVGLSVVNALSEWMTIRVKTGGSKYEINFEKGVKTHDLEKIENNLSADDTGTEIIFKIDRSIWKADDLINVKKIEDRLKTLSYLNNNLINYLNVVQNGESVIDTTYEYENGLNEFIESKIKSKKPLLDPMTIQESENGVDVSIAMVYTDSYEQDNITSFCNNAATTEHGSHVEGFKAALNKSIIDYMNFSKINVRFNSSDILEGLIAIVSIKVQDPFFDGQSKAKIKMTSVRQVVKKITEKYFKDYLDHNPNTAKIITDKIDNASKARVAAQKAKEAIRKIKETSDNPTGLAGKLAACTSKKPEECEVYIVEGDSAGGSAKQARDRHFQAILPIFGKPLNVEKKRLHDVIKSEKLLDLVRALGCGIGEEFDITKLKYHKIIIMSDADIDGNHIKILWTTFIYRYMREIIEKGHLYFSCPPLYKIVMGKETIYAKDDNEKDELVDKYSKKVTNIQRFKGLGEMNPSQLWETTMNPANRTLEQITLEDIEKDEYMLSLCMGEDVAPRKEFIMQHSLEANLDY